MKLNRTLLILSALLGATIATSFAGDPPATAKAGKAAAKAKAKAAETIPGAEAKPAAYFYTGKPYDEDLGGYVFNYRTYSPNVNRWTTPDPSGFPDGANNRIYAPVPTNEFDYLGLLSAATWGNNVVTFGGPENKWEWIKGTATIEKGADKNKTISVYKPWRTPGAPDARYNCFAFAFGHHDFWINDPADAEKVLKSEHKKIDQPMVGSIGIYRMANNQSLAHATVVEEMEGKNVKLVMQKDGTRAFEWDVKIEDVRYPGPAFTAAEYWE